MYIEFNLFNLPRRQLMRFILILLIVGVTSGCTTFSNLFSKGYSVGDLKYDSTSYSGELLNSLKADEPPLLGQVEKKCLSASIIEGDEKTCEQERNTAVFALFIQSDHMCQEHLRSIYGNEAVMNVSLGSITNLTTGLATVLAAAPTKTALSAVAFFSNAERSLANEAVYKDMLTTAVVKKIQEGRKSMAIEMDKNFSKSVNAYPVPRALLDVQRYHQTCAFMYGLRKALEEGEKPSLKTQVTRIEERISYLTKKYDNRQTQLKEYVTAARKTQEEANEDPALKGFEAALKAANNKLAALSAI